MTPGPCMVEVVRSDFEMLGPEAPSRRCDVGWPNSRFDDECSSRRKTLARDGAQKSRELIPRLAYRNDQRVAGVAHRCDSVRIRTSRW